VSIFLLNYAAKFNYMPWLFLSHVPYLIFINLPLSHCQVVCTWYSGFLILTNIVIQL